MLINQIKYFNNYFVKFKEIIDCGFLLIKLVDNFIYS